MRLIDADALMEELGARYALLVTEYGYRDYYASGFGEAIDKAEDAPTIDAVPVVRCKDCIHWYDEEGVCLKIYSDGSVSPYAWQFRNEDDFCSRGERRSDD